MHTQSPVSHRRIAFAAFAGTTIEFYDFFIYGTAAALVFGTVFFPALGPAAGTVAAIATFAVAFLARPLGSALFGHLGDRLGRKATLIATLLLMGGSTVAVGLLPGAATIGVAAPILLVILRFAQGLAVGGEWGGAALLAAEYAPAERRGRFTMYPQLGPGAAFALTSATFLIIGLAMKPADLLAWGWRIPFLLSVVLLGIGLYVRLRIEETPVFRELVAREQRTRTPIREALRKELRPILLGGGALSAVFAFGYIGTVYLTSYGTAVLGLPAPDHAAARHPRRRPARRRGRGGGCVVRSHRSPPRRAHRQPGVDRRRPDRVPDHRPRLSGRRRRRTDPDPGRRRNRTRPGRRLATRDVRRPLPLHRGRSRLQPRRDPRWRRAADHRRRRCRPRTVGSPSGSCSAGSAYSA